MRFLTLLLILLPILSFSQKTSKVSGKVIDAQSGEPVISGSVSIYPVNSKVPFSGSFTNENGLFTLYVPDTLKFDLKISFVGSITLTRAALNATKNLSLGTIKLQADVERLNEVVIEGEEDFVEFKIDKKVYNISKLQINEGTTTSEALQTIPSIEVDIDGNISLRGSENLIVLQDGKPLALSGDNLTAYLDALPTSVIENVEVMTNPSAKYDPDGMAGIININMKKTRLQGFSGNASLNVGAFGFYRASAMISTKKGKWSHMANLSYNYRDAFSEGTTYRETYFSNDSTAYLNQSTDGDRTSAFMLARLSSSYRIDDKNQLSLSAFVSARQFGRDELNYYEFRNDELELDDVYDRSTAGQGNMLPLNANLSYSKSFDKKGQRLILSTGYSLFTGDFNSQFQETLYDDDFIREDFVNLSQRQSTLPDNHTLTVQADYTHPINDKMKFETGLKTIQKTGVSDFTSELFDFDRGDWINENDLSNDFKLRESINSAYGTFQQQINKFGYQLGLRAEYAFTDAVLESTNESFFNDYVSLFPSLNLSYKMAKRQQLRASYSRRLNRPNGRMMNPFTDFSDPQNIRKGNPFLLPEYINSVEVEYLRFWNKASFTTAVYYKGIRGMITRIKEVEEGVSTVSYQNLGNGINMGVEYSLTLKPVKWWNMTLSGNAYQTIIESEESELNANGLAFNNKLLTTFILPKNYSIQLQGNYRSPKILAQGEISTMYWADVSLVKKVLKNKGTINVKLSDIFDTRQYDFITSGDIFFQESYRKRQSRIFWVGFSYNFGQFRERPGRPGGGRDDSGFGNAEID
ncbi:MAG: TonB-dependent receptor [Bacteroidia bacterium]